MDMPIEEDDCRDEEEEVDIKLHSIKVEEDYHLDHHEEEYILGLDKNLELKEEEDDDRRRPNIIQPCGQCYLNFHTRLDLATHQITSHPPPFLCFVCGKTLRSARGFLSHIQLTCGEGRRPSFGSCDNCGKVFSSSSERQSHRCSAKDIRRGKKKEKIGCIQETFLAELNDDGCSAKPHETSSQQRTSDKTSQQCLVCGSILSSLQGGLKHVLRHHKNEVRIGLASGMPSSVSCDECGLQCYDERALQAHKTWKHTHRNVVE